MSGTIESLFSDHKEKLHSLRNSDAEFEEICSHFEILLGEVARRFGSNDGSTADLIASFDDLRRDIERRLRAPPCD